MPPLIADSAGPVGAWECAQDHRLWVAAVLFRCSPAPPVMVEVVPCALVLAQVLVAAVVMFP